MKLAYTVGINNSNGGAVDFISYVLTTWIFPLFGAVAIFGIIYAGILFITASGNADQVKKARNALFYSVIAVIMVTLSYGLVRGLQNIIANVILK